MESTSRRWASAEFRRELSAWLDEHLDVTSLEPLKQRPWSTVWRVEASEGVFYAKQNCPRQNFEAALVAEIGELAPTYVVPAAAVDRARGLLLTADQGPVLEEHEGAADPEVWQRLLADATRLQRTLVPHLDRLVVEIGLTVMRPQDSAQYVATQVESLGSLPEGDPRRLPAELAARLEAMLPTIRGWGEEVAEVGLPLSLNHNDLHSQNAFVTETGLRFFDFGDAVVSDPLAVLRVPLNVLDLAADDPRTGAVTDAALELWTDHASLAALRAVLPTALRLGLLGRVESWRRCLASMTPAELEDFGGLPVRYLTMLLD